MRSSSSDAPADDASTARHRADRALFRPAGRTAWLRLVVVVVLGLAALLGPYAMEHSGALYTDRSTVSGDIWATPTITRTPTPSPA